ncbi:GAF domain-containing protein [Moorena producens JHB]|uniref:GAF domain-containing protein n=1 Tax=Moorena producens (strain JHB) TaxID=1454205 RepID=A0A1D9FW65_MOOP1|nr:adenylate/guanylate cyclase domain-containing protein [Moorena producens]AOY79555.1 GAF domain-containing protein [Moorena producens JHB]
MVAASVYQHNSNQVEKGSISEANSSAAGSLVAAGQGISNFLAPLNRESLKQVVPSVESALHIVNQTLSMLDALLENQDFEKVLQEILNAITLKTAELMNADRVTIFFLDEDKNELWSVVAKGEGNNTLGELRFPADQGIVGEVATFKRVVNVPYDFYDDPRSNTAKKSDQKTGYRTYTLLALPLLTLQGDLVAVVQLLNKVKNSYTQNASLNEKIDQQGFTEEDQKLFNDFAPSMRLVLESSKSLYRATQRQRAATALIKATESLNLSSLDLDETLKRVMDEAKTLMKADRSTLWLIDRERNELWAQIPQADGSSQEIRIPMGVGFAGKVAQTGEALNIPFDLYDHPNSYNSKKVDQESGYRTCSLLCMPVYNSNQELIGVTQLVNKKKTGDFEPYNPNDWPKAPECWKASFNRIDEAYMKAFNIQAGVAIQRAKLFATIKQQEQIQRDMLRSLSNGVISTDKTGKIIATNESAKKLLGYYPGDSLEGLSVSQLINIKGGNFAQWLQKALTAKTEKDSRQYYPDQTLISQGLESTKHCVNLSINSIADASDQTHVYGALVVMDDISDEKRLKTTMYRYMTQELAEELLKLDDHKLGGDRKEVSVLFSDIRGYTALTESLNAEEVVGMLNDYFESMVDAIFEYKGTLDKYIGDAIMAVFGSPLPQEDHAWRAVQTALEMRRRLKDFNQQRVKAKRKPLKIGIGINSDSVISGNMGSTKRMEFTSIGDGVNLGARLETASKQYGCDILISENTYRACVDQIWARELDKVIVKGKTKPVSIYELVGLKSEPISEYKARIIEHYYKGRQYYLQRQFALAMGEFGTILEKYDKHDQASVLHLNRCQRFLQEPPNHDWDGGWKLLEK